MKKKIRKIRKEKTKGNLFTRISRVSKNIQPYMFLRHPTFILNFCYEKEKRKKDKKRKDKRKFAHTDFPCKQKYKTVYLFLR